MWDGISGILESAAAYVFLGDRLSKPTEYLGLVLTFIGIFLLKSAD
jgi:multidrug transporter EmrE-like cation transporter